MLLNCHSWWKCPYRQLKPWPPDPLESADRAGITGILHEPLTPNPYYPGPVSQIWQPQGMSTLDHLHQSPLFSHYYLRCTIPRSFSLVPSRNTPLRPIYTDKQTCHRHRDLLLPGLNLVEMYSSLFWPSLAVGPGCPSSPYVAWTVLAVLQVTPPVSSRALGPEHTESGHRDKLPCTYADDCPL